MPYEIPQQLQYEEKIIFGLTFRQLAYAGIFLVPCLLIFFKSNFSVYTKAVFITILVGIASLFMFFNFMSYIKDIIKLIQFRDVEMMDPKMIQFLSIIKIEKGVIHVGKIIQPAKART